jgi:hypothetical protein
LVHAELRPVRRSDDWSALTLSMDCRVKPGNDEGGGMRFLGPPRTEFRATVRPQ